jgi:hypothetical protein
MGQAAASWNEQTDAKGYWVSTQQQQVESLDGLDLLEPDSLEVPEFTLSGAEATDAGSVDERPLARWESMPTHVPDDAFDEVTAPTDEVFVPRGRRVANVIVSREPSMNVPAAPPEPAPKPAPAPQPTPELLDPKAIAAEMARKAASGTLTMEERREMAARMARAAKAQPQKKVVGVVRLADHRPPGSLPPTEDLAVPEQPEPTPLPERSQERWGWDEADPLAVAERPSLSIVQAAEPASDDYDDYLATPLPAPPRPQLQLPWPLPAPRARVSPDQLAELVEPLITEAQVLDEVQLAEAPVASRGSMLPTVMVVGGFLMALGAFALLSMTVLVAAVVLAAVL